MPRKAKLGICVLMGLMLAVVLPSIAMAHHEGYSTEGFGGVQPHVAQAGHEIQDTFGVEYVSGYRAGDGDHSEGLALDFMVYDDTAKGDAITDHVLANWEHYDVEYVIWKQRINFGSGWQLMEDRGSVTANHYDHPHISFNPQSSTATEAPAENPPEESAPSTATPAPAEQEPAPEDDAAPQPTQSPEPSTDAPAPAEQEPMTGEPAPAPQPATEEPAAADPAPVEEEPAADEAVQPQSAPQSAVTGQPGNAGQSSSVSEPGNAGQTGVGEAGSVEQSGGSIQSMDDMGEVMSLPAF